MKSNSKFYTFECRDGDGERFVNDIFNLDEYGLALHQHTVLDVGAHVGIFTALIHPFAKQIYSIEPDGDNFKNLEENIRANNLTRAKAFNVGLWSHTGDERFERRGSGGGTTGMGNDSIQVMTLHDFVIKNNIPTITLMKLDCEDGENAILTEPQSRYIIQSIPTICLEHASEGTERYMQNIGFRMEKRNRIKFFFKV